MSTNITLSFIPAAVSLTYFATDFTGATITLANTATPDDLAHRISIRNNSATDHSGKTITFVGTDSDDKAQTETRSLPGSSATVETTNYFKTITSAVISATIGSDTMDLGYVDEFISQSIPLDWRAINNVTTFEFTVDGTINYTMQNTLYAIQDLNPDEVIWQNSPDPYLVESTTSVTRSYYSPVKAIRIVVNSYSSGAILGFNCIGSG